MARVLTCPVRVLNVVKEIYGELAKDLGIALSDLISVVLMYGGSNPSLLAYILQNQYGLEPETANKIAFDIAKKIQIRFNGVLY